MRATDEIIHNGKTLTEILRLHKMWSRGEDGGERADLSGANLAGANLAGAYLAGAKFVYNGIDSKRFTVFNNLYKYCVYAILSTDGTQYVRLGCKFYSREDWLAGKGDNPSEFPDDGSESSELRKFALATAFAWLDVIEAQEKKKG